MQIISDLYPYIKLISWKTWKSYSKNTDFMNGFILLEGYFYIFLGNYIPKFKVLVTICPDMVGIFKVYFFRIKASHTHFMEWKKYRIKIITHESLWKYPALVFLLFSTWLFFSVNTFYTARVILSSVIFFKTWLQSSIFLLKLNVEWNTFVDLKGAGI